MTSFQIDGSDVKNPANFAYEERYSPFENANGFMNVSAFRAAMATFNILTTAADQLQAWMAADDGASHSIKCPAPDSNTYTTYSNVRIKYVDSEISQSQNGAVRFYRVTFRVSHISTDSLPAFGAQASATSFTVQTMHYTQPQAVIGMGLAVHIPATIWGGTVTDPTYPADGTGVGTLTVTATSSGAYTALMEGMTVKLTNAAGTASYWTYARKASGANNVLYIDGLGKNTLSDVATFIVYAEFLPWPRRHRYSSPDWLVNFDETFANQTEALGPQAIVTGDSIFYVDGSVTFNFFGSGSRSWTPGETIASYAWVFPDGTTSSSADPTWATSTAYSSGAYTHLTVTDTDGQTHTRHWLIFKFDSTHPPKRDFEVTTLGGEWGGGWRCELQSPNTNLGSTYGSAANHVILFGQTAYGSTVVDVGGNIAYRWNVWIDGYVTASSVEYSADHYLYTYTIETIDALLNSLDSFPLSMDDTASASPATWLEMNPCTLDNIMIHCCRWRTTLMDVANIYLPETTATGRAKKFMDLSPGTIWEQLKQIYSWIVGGTVSVDWHGQVWAEQDALINSTITPTASAVLYETPTTILRPYLQGSRPAKFVLPVSKVTLYGVDYATPIGSRAPDDPIMHGGRKHEIPAGLHMTQTEANSWARYLRDKLNNTETARQYPTVGLIRVDCAPQNSLSVDGGTSYPLIIRAVSVEFDSENGMAFYSYECERYPILPSGVVGVAVDFFTIP